MRYYIGLDNGGTATKAAVFDERGREIGTCGVATKAITPKPGFVERDMEEMWDANCAVLKGVLEKTGIDAGDVAGVGISGHGKGLYLWGKDDKPARNGIISTDNRAYRYPLEWRANGVEEMAFHRSLQHIMACQPTALLAWLRDNEPESYANIKYVFECKDYIRFRLTGEARAEVTDYSGSGLMNLWTVNFDQELLDMYGIPEVKDALPPTCRATEICGYVTEEAAAKSGLKAGTPVIGGMFDINACAIAAGVTEWFIRELLPELKEKEKAAGGSIYDTVDRWVEEIPVTEFVPLFLPFLMASNVHPNAKACFLGMSVSHGRAHLARSIFEGITFCHKYHYERLMATRSEAPEVIRLAGGAARAKVWAQMFADVMNTPVQTLEANETGALGCAIAVAAATGAYPSLDEAIKNMTVFSEPILPDPKAVAVYEKKYQLYKKALESLDGLWDDMQALVEGK